MMFDVCEGMWALVQDKVSDIPFAAEWAEHASFAEYGTSYLQRAATALGIARNGRAAAAFKAWEDQLAS